MEFKTIRGAIRHSEIQSEMDAIDLKQAWIEFMLGKTMCAIDENEEIRLLSNQGVYPVDLERFCRWKKINVVVTLGDKQ